MDLENCSASGEGFLPIPQSDGAGNILCSNFFMDKAGEISATLTSDGLFWTPSRLTSYSRRVPQCFRVKQRISTECEIAFSDVYAVELINAGSLSGSIPSDPPFNFRGHHLQMYFFTIHVMQKSSNKLSPYVPVTYTFGHTDQCTCEVWVNQINYFLKMEADRPRRLLVFVHPMSGKGKGCRVWESVAPIFSRAGVQTMVMVTARAGHAFDVMKSISKEDLDTYDGAVAVGGDGFFNEILNGFLSTRHNAPCPPSPTHIFDFLTDNNHGLDCDDSRAPFDSSSPYNGKYQSTSRLSNPDHDREFNILNKRFRFGIIPAGSTDAIVLCTTGYRDPITSALQVVLGKRIRLDIAQIGSWKSAGTSQHGPCIRYTASFAGYGFYGDIIKESEKYRWMGPRRYDYAGTKVFMRHRSYDAELAYLEVKSENSSVDTASVAHLSSSSTGKNRKHERTICRMNCKVCTTAVTDGKAVDMSSKWLRTRGRYLSIGAAVISCRNDRAPDGLVVDAHLSDGLLHLIMIRDCSHALYLRHLTELARRGGEPLKFEFIEHYKTPAFVFCSRGERASVWNVDGELVEAHQLSAQVFHGLVNLFAAGPEV